jgi:hypothetical protein
LNNFFDKSFLTRFFLTIFLLLFLFQSVFGLTTAVRVQVNSVQMPSYAISWGESRVNTQCGVRGGWDQLAAEIYTHSNNGVVDSDGWVANGLFSGGDGGPTTRTIDTNIHVPSGELKRNASAFITFERDLSKNYFLRISLQPGYETFPNFEDASDMHSVIVGNDCTPIFFPGNKSYVNFACWWVRNQWDNGWDSRGCSRGGYSIWYFSKKEITRNCSVPAGVYRQPRNFYYSEDGSYLKRRSQPDPLYPQRFCINFGQIM